MLNFKHLEKYFETSFQVKLSKLRVQVRVNSFKMFHLFVECLYVKEVDVILNN